MKTLFNKYLFVIYLLGVCFLSNANTPDNLSLSVDGFLENQGQMMDMEGNPVPFVLFKAEAPGVNLWITEKGMTMQTFQIRRESLADKEIEELESGNGELSGHKKTKKFIDWERIDLDLKGANIKKENIIKEDARQGHNNYFYPHCPDGIYGVKEYQKVTIQNVYPNIDWVIYRTSKSFKYDFVVHPGGDYKQIELVYHSKTPVQINEQGQLTFTTNYGNLQENKPVSFYENKEVTTQFVQNYQYAKTISGDVGYETSIGFRFPKRVKSLLTDLVIDPQLVWGTFYSGGAHDVPSSIDTDTSGNVFATGQTTSNNFPLQNSGTYFQGTFLWLNIAFILKFNNNGNRIWATYYGGSGADYAHFVTIDNTGNIIITGNTGSNDFPVQDAGTFFQGIRAGNFDVFILKFDNAGNRLWATHYGGNSNDWGHSASTDNNGNIFVTGYTASSNFPVQNSGTFFQGVNAGSSNAFILKFDSQGNRLWATYYGGSTWGLASSIVNDSNGNVFIVGQTNSSDFPVQNAATFFQNNNAGGTDGFILKFDNLGNRLWATYYGDLADDHINNIAIDNNGNIFLIGYCQSSNFPLQNAGTFFQGTKGGGNYDGFILKFDNLGNRNWATFYGGNLSDYTGTYYDNIDVDSYGNLYVTFITKSNPFPHLLNSCDYGYFDNTYNGGTMDNLLSIFSNNGNLLWSTYLGGDGYNRGLSPALDKNDNLFIISHSELISNALSYPLLNPGSGAYYDTTTNGNGDVYIAKFLNAPCLNCPSSSSNFSPVICNGDSLYVGGSWQTTTGTYYDTLVNSCGSDSILITNLLVNPQATSTDIITSCTPITWIDGNTYSTTTNTPTFTIVGGATNGCDSIVTLDLTINSFVTGIDIISSCTPIIWIDGNTYSATTNTPTFTIIGGGANGCDSITALNLTINSPTSITQNYNECEGFSVTVGLNTYSTTGTFIDVLNDCDTVITNLIISSNCEPAIFIPNVFSPNGDNQNDLFMVQFVGLKFKNLQIYNRWGVLMFETNNINVGWDGKTTAGVDVPEGTYFYIIDAKGLTKKGSITLLR